MIYNQLNRIVHIYSCTSINLFLSTKMKIIYICRPKWRNMCLLSFKNNLTTVSAVQGEKARRSLGCHHCIYYTTQVEDKSGNRVIEEPGVVDKACIDLSNNSIPILKCPECDSFCGYFTANLARPNDLGKQRWPVSYNSSVKIWEMELQRNFFFICSLILIEMSW